MPAGPLAAFPGAYGGTAEWRPCKAFHIRMQNVLHLTSPEPLELPPEPGGHAITFSALSAIAFIIGSRND